MVTDHQLENAPAINNRQAKTAIVTRTNTKMIVGGTLWESRARGTTLTGYLEPGVGPLH